MKLKKALFIFSLVLGISLVQSSFFSTQTFANAPQIRITEIMYDPLGNGDKEFIEIYNGSDVTVNLGGWSFSNGVKYSFPGGTTLAPGKYGVVVRNSPVFRASYPNARVFGQYAGKLVGSGELVRLVNSSGAGMTQVDYRSGGGWPISPRNGGPSLSLIRPNADETVVGCWGASTAMGGSPGFANSASGGGSCPNKAYYMAPPPVPAPNAPNQNSGGSGSSGSGGTQNPQNRTGQNGDAGGLDNPNAGTGDVTLENLSPEERAILEEESKLEDSEDRATLIGRGGDDVTKLGAGDPAIKKLVGLLTGAFIVSAGAGFVLYEKFHKHTNKHDFYRKIKLFATTTLKNTKLKLKDIFKRKG
jgi:hypothetical protein